MTSPPRRWVVTFDIASDTARHAVHQILGQHGLRILYSVYDLTATDTTMDQLIEQLRPHIDRSDHLLALPHCDLCVTATTGPPIEDHPDHAWIAT